MMMLGIIRESLNVFDVAESHLFYTSGFLMIKYTYFAPKQILMSKIKEQ